MSRKSKLLSCSLRNRGRAPPRQGSRWIENAIWGPQAQARLDPASAAPAASLACSTQPAALAVRTNAYPQHSQGNGQIDRADCDDAEDPTDQQPNPGSNSPVAGDHDHCLIKGERRRSHDICLIFRAEQGQPVDAISRALSRGRNFSTMEGWLRLLCVRLTAHAEFKLRAARGLETVHQCGDIVSACCVDGVHLAPLPQADSNFGW